MTPHNYFGFGHILNGWYGYISYNGDDVLKISDEY